MEPILFPRLEVLQGLFEALEKVSSTRFITSRPSVIGEQIDDFVVIRNSTGIRDRGDTYQTAKVMIHLFVRDRPGEIENAWRLQQMQDALCSLCPLKHPRFTADDPNYISSGADSGFHYVIYQLSLTINKKQL